MIDWMHDLPIGGAAFIIACFLVPTLLGSAFLQPMMGRLLRGEKDPNAAVGLLLNTFTLYYAVLLALLSIAVFENYDKAQEAIGREASSVIVLYREVRAYPEPTRTSLIDLLRRYVDEETGPGWGEQRQDRASSSGNLLIDEFSRQLLSFQPNRSTGEDILYGETLRSFGEFIDRRRIRIQAAGTIIPSVIWIVVLTGAALNVFVLWLFNLQTTTHFIVGGVMMVFVALVVYMVAVLDQPFRGAHGLTPDDLVYAREQMSR